MKRQYADKWATDVLEQIAVVCNVASNAKTSKDWELFLNTLYDVSNSLPRMQRAILLLSQEHSLSYADIARVLGMPSSTVMYNMKRAIDTIVKKLKKLSLLDMTVRDDSKIARKIYSGVYSEVNNEKSDTGFYHGEEPPFFYAGENILFTSD